MIRSSRTSARVRVPARGVLVLPTLFSFPRPPTPAHMLASARTGMTGASAIRSMPDAWPARLIGVGEVCAPCVRGVSSLWGDCRRSVAQCGGSGRCVWRAMGHLIAPSRRRGNAGRRTQNVGVGTSPTPTYRGGEPPGTRTPNPLIKSQLGVDGIAATQMAPGLRRSPASSPLRQSNLLTRSAEGYSTRIRGIGQESEKSHEMGGNSPKFPAHGLSACARRHARSRRMLFQHTHPPCCRGPLSL